MEHPWKLATPNLWRQPASADGKGRGGKRREGKVNPNCSGPSPQSKHWSIAGNVSVSASKLKFAQGRAVKGLAWRGGVHLLSSFCIQSIRPYEAPSSSPWRYVISHEQISMPLSPSTFGRHRGLSHRGWNHPPCGQQCYNLSPPLMFLE